MDKKTIKQIIGNKVVYEALDGIRTNICEFMQECDSSMTTEQQNTIAQVIIGDLKSWIHTPTYTVYADDGKDFEQDFEAGC